MNSPWARPTAPNERTNFGSNDTTPAASSPRRTHCSTICSGPSEGSQRKYVESSRDACESAASIAERLARLRVDRVVERVVVEVVVVVVGVAEAILREEICVRKNC